MCLTLYESFLQDNSDPEVLFLKVVIVIVYRNYTHFMYTVQSGVNVLSPYERLS